MRSVAVLIKVWGINVGTRVGGGGYAGEKAIGSRVVEGNVTTATLRRVIRGIWRRDGKPSPLGAPADGKRESLRRS